MPASKTSETSSIKTVILKSFAVLSPREKARVYAVGVIQILLGFLDLLGVALIGVIGSLAVNGIQSKSPGSRIGQFIEFVGLDGFTFQTQVAIIGLVATVILVSRTLISMYFSKKILHFLARRAALTSNLLVSDLLGSSFSFIQKRSKQETIFAVTEGVNMMMLNIIGTVVGVTADLFLLTILSIGLFIVNPFIAIGTFAIFACVGLILYLSISKRVNMLGNEIAQLTIFSSERISEAITNYKELYVRDKREHFASLINDSRKRIAWNSAEIAFIPNLGKYVIETTMVIGAILICGIQFYIADATQAISVLAVFLAAGGRIAPAVLRIQSGALSIKGSHGAVNRTISLMDELSSYGGEVRNKVQRGLGNISEFSASFKLENVNFQYPGDDKKVLNGINLQVKAGETLAIVGPSGAGKSTLVDLILGLFSPTSGEILVSGVFPEQAIKKWPGSIAYVPQNVSLITGTVAENIALGYANVDIERVKQCIKMAHLDSYVDQLEIGINTQIGESGRNMSGGQLQRIGIARALYTNPKILVLDEATSALDGKTEMEVSDSIMELQGEITLILIAHRLSTVVRADKIIYLADGLNIYTGSFEELKKAVPDFAEQASIMGL
jgi:ABC-type multidrug transport system fused ATPase/permease subunit